VKGMFWVTRMGDVLESQDVPKPGGAGRSVVPCRRVSSGAFLGTRLLENLRPATNAEVDAARKKGKR